MSATEFDIAVIGAGMTGAAMALSLIKQNPTLRLVIVDQNPLQLHVNEELDSRVVALSHQSMAVLQQAGLSPLSPIWKKSAPYTAMSVLDGEGTGQVDFDTFDARAEDLGVIIENQRLTAALHEELTAVRGITALFNTHVEHIEKKADEVCLRQSDSQLIRVNLAIAADGVQSPTRNILKIPTRKWSYNQKAIVTVI